jgi:hypothetical protein
MMGKKKENRAFVRGYLVQAANSVSDILNGVRKRLDHNEAWLVIPAEKHQGIINAINQMDRGSDDLHQLVSLKANAKPMADCEIPF